MRIETINYNNIEHAFPNLGNLNKDADYQKDIEKSVQWIMKSMHNGLRGRIAFDGFKKPIGTIFYGPLKHMNAPVDANVSVIYLLSLYVDPDKRKAGIGPALVYSMKTDSRSYAGVVAIDDGSSPDLNNKNLESCGFKSLMEQDNSRYMFLPIRADGVKLRVSPLTYKSAGLDVEITLFNDGFCPLENHRLKQVQRMARTFGSAVTIRELDLTPTRARQYGTSAICLVDGQPLLDDSSDEDIRLSIQKAISNRLLPKGMEGHIESGKTLGN